MLQKLFLWMEQYSEHKHAKKILALVAFTESSFFPIPPFVFIIAMLSHEKRQSWIKLALVGMSFSVLGGIFAYFLGMFFYATIGAPLIAFYGIQNEVNTLGALFKDHVFLTILAASLSPLPYKVFTISAGLFAVNIWSFVLSSIVGRSLRFFIVAYIANKYGTKAKKVLLDQQKNVTYIFLVLIVVGILWYVLKT